MSLILKLLGGSLGPYIAGAVGVVLAGLLLTLSIQSARLAHAKSDLVAARAALVDPVSHRTWRDIAGSAIAGRDAALASLSRQNSEVAALKAESDRKTAASAEATASALSARKAAEKAGDSLLALQSKLAGRDECDKARAVFGPVKDSLQ